MRVIILGGNSVRNRAWAEDVARAVTAAGQEAYAHVHRHWETVGGSVDIDYELRALRSSGVVAGEYRIIAKSMGCLLALKASSQGWLRPVSAVFLGFPLAVVLQEALPVEEWIKSFTAEAKFIQNEFDPLGSYVSVRQYLDGAGVPAECTIPWPGSTHDYMDVQAIAKISSSLVANLEPGQSKSPASR